MATIRILAKPKPSPFTAEQGAAINDIAEKYHAFVQSQKTEPPATDDRRISFERLHAFSVEIGRWLWWHYLNALANQHKVSNAFAYRRSILSAIKRYWLKRDVTLDDLVKAYSEAGEVSPLVTDIIKADLEAMEADRINRRLSRRTKPRGYRRRKRFGY